LKHVNLEGIVLKRRSIGESDRLLTIFTRKFGKLSIKAPGVRKITSRRSPHIEPLNVVIFSLYRGKGAPILTEAKTVLHFANIKNDLGRLATTYYLCELVDGLCAEGQEQEVIYALFHKALQDVDKGADPVSLIAEFERQIITLLGFYRNQTQELENVTSFIENILERRLRTKRLLYRFT
jgi:DNA repair protein RecO (recombination protein O)